MDSAISSNFTRTFTIKPLVRFGHLYFFTFLFFASFIHIQHLLSQTLSIAPYKTIAITEPAQQNKPKYAAISVNTQRDIYLTDIALNRILRLDSTGMLIREVGGFGWSNQQFDRPLDIWAENALDVFVVDYNNHRIQRFDRRLNFVSAIENDSNLDPRLQFGFPVSVAFSRFGEIFIAEQEHNRILQIDANGLPVRSFGDYDWGAGSLEEPVQIAISANEEIFVADAMRKAVVKFDYYGNYLQEIRHDSLTSVDAIAVGSGSLAALDAKKKQVLVFSASGKLLLNPALTTWTSRPPLAENEPDIAIAGKMLYILDSAASEILCFYLRNSSR